MITWAVLGVLFGGLLYAVYRVGKTDQQRNDAEKINEVKDAQLKAAVNKPDKSATAKRLRDGKF